MNLLLDTHTFIWFSEGNKSLPEKAKELIEDINNTSFISMASLWEMSIKISLNKLQIKIPFENLYEVIIENGFVVLPISFSHIVIQNKLDYHHREPFDRLLISQSISEEMPFIATHSWRTQSFVHRTENPLSLRLLLRYTSAPPLCRLRNHASVLPS